MGDLAALLLLPFAAAVIFVGMHTWLGLQVLRRGVVFADLALAQLSALGATIAVAAGHAPGSTAGFGYALLLTGCGAVLLTFSRRVAAQVSQEAIIGILYVLATALTVLVVDRSPQGAEHVKRMLVGDILIVGLPDVQKLALLYGAVALVHIACRRKLLAAAEGGSAGGRPSPWLWDLVFYASFGLVVTSSVAMAGVLLVFAFLIIPAVIGTLFSQRYGVALGIGWAAGALASLLGFAGSVAFDLPTGAAMVAAFAIVLLAALPVRLLGMESPAARARRMRRAVPAITGVAIFAVLAQGVWLVASPESDQPLLAVFERASGIGPERSLTAGERRIYLEAGQSEQRHRSEVERLRAMEREARWNGDGLSDENLRRAASFQQTFNEMGRGERFVQDHLRTLARQRERWTVGVPAIAISALTLLLLARRVRRGALAAAIPRAEPSAIVSARP